ncbi:MAG: hypothetical protein FWC36_00760 [Spirochaetes bacterium]|nr:hypothetical protein [Spirochaetota bacterium]
MTDVYKCSAKIWWKDIERLANLFLDFVNKQPKDKTNTLVLKLQGLNLVKEAYYSNLQAFKKKAYGKNADENRIDNHKIIALYIKSFLEVSPFYLEGSSNEPRTEIQSCPNEYFSFELMNLILTAWNELKEPICLKKEEKKWFIILLNHFRLNTINVNMLDVLSLSQIIYYIEDKYITSRKKDCENTTG